MAGVAAFPGRVAASVIDLHTYLLFIGASVLLVLAPGPDMAYLLARTLAQGRRAGLLAVVGINAGAYVHVAAVVLGLSAVLATSALAFTAVKWLGAGYLVWIGVQALRHGSRELQQDGTAAPLNARRIFWQGFLSDVLNPKVALFFLALLPQFVDARHATLSVTMQLLVLGVTGNVLALGINCALVCVASAVSGGLRRRTRLVTWLHRGMGAVLIALGLRLAREKL